MTMHRSCWWPSAGLVGLALLVNGCGYDPFAPPNRSKSVAKPGEVSESRPNFLVFVVPAVPGPDEQAWAMRAQHEANDKRAIFRIMGPRPGETPFEQPKIVQRAVAEGASALIVYPGGSPELPKALAEAEAKGVPVVLVGKGVAAPEGAKAFTVAEHAPFEESARKIVAATIDDLKKANRPVDGTAILLVDQVEDGTSARRVAALKAAAEAAKFRQVVTVRFDGAAQDPPTKLVLDAVKANPDVSVVLTDDGEGMVGAAQARAESRGKPVFFVAGFTDYRTSRVMTPPFRESCYVEGRYSELGGLAVLTALAKIRGESVGEHSYLPAKFTKAEGAVSTEAEPMSSFPELKKADRTGKIIEQIEPVTKQGRTDRPQ